MARMTRNTKCSLFTIFTDTTSRLDDFYFKPVGKKDPLIKAFPPIVNIARLDYHANYHLDTSIDKDEVAQAERLLHFGRAVWLGYSRNGASIDDLVHLAGYKTTLHTVDDVRTLFDEQGPKDTSKVHPALVAVVASRLALHIGPYVTLVHDLVASHMMIPISENRRQVRAIYPPDINVFRFNSTPRLEGPLETLIHLLHHGIVPKRLPRGIYWKRSSVHGDSCS
jgi:hypothetical protein